MSGQPPRRVLRIAPAVAVAIAVVLSACGTRLPDSAFDTTTVPGGRPGTAAPQPSTAPQQNTASDVGVTPTSVKVGLVVSMTSPLGGEAFSGARYGVQAFVDGLNRRGGVAGRTVELVVCDDGATGAGNQECVRKLVEDDAVFAFVGNVVFDYAGAAFVNDAAVPDIGGQPIGNEYQTYRHLFSIYGTNTPRDGTVGYDGVLYGGTEIYRYFKTEQRARRAAVVAYNQADSLRYAQYTADGLEAEGFGVVVEQVALGVPNWDAVVLDMKDRGVQLVFDALESTGNVNLCRAIDRNGMDLVAKVVTVQGWTDEVRSTYADAPRCRNALWATSNTRNYDDTQYPPVRQFRDDMEASFPERMDRLSMWTLEGWAAGQWFADAAESCGAALTRVCVEAFLNDTVGYDGHGLLQPRDFRVTLLSERTGRTRNCLNVARWSDDAQDGRGGWVTQVEDMDENCFDVPEIAYEG